MSLSTDRSIVSKPHIKKIKTKTLLINCARIVQLRIDCRKETYDLHRINMYDSNKDSKFY